MKREIIVEIISFLLIALFAYAAINKFLDIETFKAQAGQSPLISFAASWIVYAVPGIELMLCGLLSFPKTRLTGLYGSFVLMNLFTGYIISILWFSYYVPCSCGGILEKMGWTEHLIFNIVFVLLSLTGIVLSYERNAWHFRTDTL